MLFAGSVERLNDNGFILVLLGDEGADEGDDGDEGDDVGVVTSAASTIRDALKSTTGIGRMTGKESSIIGGFNASAGG